MGSSYKNNASVAASSYTKDAGTIKTAKTNYNRTFIQQAIASNDIVVFSKSYCPYCAATKRLIGSEYKKNAAQVYELDRMPMDGKFLDELQRMTGQRTVPNVFVKGQHIGGNDDTQAAHLSGKLAQLLVDPTTTTTTENDDTRKESNKNKEFIEQTISSSDIVVFSKSYCPYCTATKELIRTQYNNSNNSVQVYELDQMEDGYEIQNELQRMTGQRTVPNVFVKRQHVGGNDVTRAAHRSGALREMLIEDKSYPK